MGEYFQPWRRKFGVVLLGLACVLAGGWLRSKTYVDAIDWRINQIQIVLLSLDDHLGLAIVEEDESIEISFPEWQTMDFEALEQVLQEAGNPAWHFECLGLHLAISIASSSVYWLIFPPYWSVVAPLALLSAWLLLSKPKRQSSITTAANLII